MAEQEAKTFLEAPGTDFYQMLADKLITEMPPDKRVGAIEALLLTAAKEHQDDAALLSVDLLAKAYEQEEGAIAGGKGNHRRANERYYTHLLKLYWRLPDARKKHEHGIDGKWEWVPKGTLVKTKLHILRVVMGRWYATPTESSVRAFRFLIAAYQPRPASKDWRHDPTRMPEYYRDDFRYAGESDDEVRARGRFVSKEEQKGILELIREHTGNEFYWPAKDLEPWLEQPIVPDEIQRILVLARARNGGSELARRDIRNAKLLQLFRPDERSPDALRLLEALGGAAARLDTEARKLPVIMQPDSDLANAEQIGGSEYVLGKITIWYDNPTLLRVSVHLPSDCSEELGRDVFGRARRHLDSWLFTHGWFRAKLWVTGVKKELDFHYPDDPGQYAGGPCVHPTAEESRA